MGERRATSFTLPEETVALIRSAGHGNVSRYVDRVFAQRHAEWHAALDYLLEQGVSQAQLREACEALPNSPPFPIRPAQSARPGLEVAGIRATGDAAGRALLVCAREWWADNDAFLAAVGVG